MIADNILTDHGSSAIAGSDSTVEVTRNTILRNQLDGIRISQSTGVSTAIITANVISQNTGNGITIAGASAAITSGTITQNLQDGIALSGTSTADIGLQGDTLTIARNGGAGIFITNDRSLAHIDRTRIVFDSNAGGAIVGPFQARPLRAHVVRSPGFTIFGCLIHRHVLAALLLMYDEGYIHNVTSSHALPAM